MTQRHRKFIFIAFMTLVLGSTSQVGFAQGSSNLIISEFRTFGRTGNCDEFIEIYNASNSPYSVQSIDNTPGFAVAQSNGNVLFVIPNGTVIPARPVERRRVQLDTLARHPARGGRER